MIEFTSKTNLTGISENVIDTKRVIDFTRSDTGQQCLKGLIDGQVKRPLWLLSLIIHESNGNPLAFVKSSGAAGLFQITGPKATSLNINHNDCLLPAYIQCKNIGPKIPLFDTFVRTGGYHFLPGIIPPSLDKGTLQTILPWSSFVGKIFGSQTDATLEQYIRYYSVVFPAVPETKRYLSGDPITKLELMGIQASESLFIKKLLL